MENTYYLTHSTITNGTGRGFSRDLLDVIAEKDALESLLAILLDGTAVNVGWKEGLFVHVERELQRKLLLISCMLHANELTVRHFFKFCDGGHGTSGPESFAGPLGQTCKGDIHLLDVCNFEPIESSVPDLPEKVWKDLSMDQQLMYRTVKAITAGEVPTTLATIKCGPLNHAWWLTLAIRLLSLFTRTSFPCEGLNAVVKFIMQVYAPSWFIIKKKHRFTSGTENFFYQMKFVCTQSEEVQRIVQPVVQHNA